jgi:hypothetical protein
VTGNVFHHAVEMFLKGALAKTKPLSDLKKLGHNLPNIWKEFRHRRTIRHLMSLIV